MSDQSDERAVAGDDRHRVADRTDLPDGGRVIVEIDEREIAVFNLGGSYHAFANYCPHQGGPACEGRISGILTTGGPSEDWALRYDRENEVLSCPWHGWEFDLLTGELIANDRYGLISYETTVEDDTIYVVA